MGITEYVAMNDDKGKFIVVCCWLEKILFLNYNDIMRAKISANTYTSICKEMVKCSRVKS